MRDFFNDTSALALNTATLGHMMDGYGVGWSPEQVIDACAARNFGAITFWRREIGERAVEIGDRVRDTGLQVAGLCRSPFLVGPLAPSDHAELVDDFRASIDMAAGLQADSLTIVVGGVVEGSHSMRDSLMRVTDLVADMVPHAKASNVRLGLEPLNPVYGGNRSCLVTARDAVDIALAIGDPIVTVAVDVYHVWWDLTLGRELARLGGDRIAGFHLCDWLADTTDVLLDRGMMGDGVADLKHIRSMVEDTGFAGICEVEVFSANNWWKRDPNEVLDVIVERFRTVC